MPRLNMRQWMLCLVLASLATPATSARDHPGDDEVYEACRERGGTDPQCHCVTVEAGSRFSSEELELIADMSGNGRSSQERAASLQARGVTPQLLSELTRRLITAEPVIQSTCGMGLMRRPRD